MQHNPYDNLSSLAVGYRDHNASLAAAGTYTSTAKDTSTNNPNPLSTASASARPMDFSRIRVIASSTQATSQEFTLQLSIDGTNWIPVVDKTTPDLTKGSLSIFTADVPLWLPWFQVVYVNSNASATTLTVDLTLLQN